MNDKIIDSEISRLLHDEIVRIQNAKSPTISRAL